MIRDLEFKVLHSFDLYVFLLNPYVLHYEKNLTGSMMKKIVKDTVKL